ncbi:hypothetical protein ACFQ1S_07435 [Kibdelosporangium lantanae]|uniref:Uncharacterized protein n=1 Tax=Kibdelosporangium lantanae TaxID=1497396 RepID=A0ABW3M5X6_9PSEU
MRQRTHQQMCLMPHAPPVSQATARNVAGTVNRIFSRDYHEVTRILAPGRTVSVMVRGRWLHDTAHQGVWGYLDLHTGNHVPVRRSHAEQARFRARLHWLNPQHAAKGPTVVGPLGTARPSSVPRTLS